MSSGLFDSSTGWTSQDHSNATNATSDLCTENENTLLCFLNAVQYWKLDMLPISWQPALEAVGKGGTASIHQSFLNKEFSFAFKRMKLSEGVTEPLRPLISEVLALGNPNIRNHANIMRLEGFCWEIDPFRANILPVLVFEKSSYRSLFSYMFTEEGVKMDMHERLECCWELASALETIHENGIIHGDIKPQNVIAFKSQSGQLVPKLADFGYSSTVTNVEYSTVLLPSSEPWVAPERHHRSFSFFDAIKADIYSFGLMCVWILFANDLGNSSGLEEVDGPFAEEARATANPAPARRSLQKLASLKEDGLLHFCLESLDAGPESINKNNLIQFFTRSLSDSPESREAKVNGILNLLHDERQYSPLPGILLSAAPHDLPHFSMIEYLPSLAESDYRIRSWLYQYFDRLYVGSSASCNKCTQTSRHELAFCNKVGFGHTADSASYDGFHKAMALEEQQRLDQSLQRLAALRTIATRYTNPSMQELFEKNYLHRISYGDDYTAAGILDHAIHTIETEINDLMAGAGKDCYIVFLLRSIMVLLLSSQGRFKEAEYMQSSIIAEYSDDLSELDVGVLTGKLASFAFNQGHFKRGMEIVTKVLDNFQKSFGKDDPRTILVMGNLGSFLVESERFGEAETVLQEAMQLANRNYGETHLETLRTMSNLAEAYRRLGKLEESEELYSRTLKLRKEALGSEHEDYLITLQNLSVLHETQGLGIAVSEAEAAATGFERKLGRNHPATITSVYNLIARYSSFKQLDKALQQQDILMSIFNASQDENRFSTIQCELKRVDIFIQQGRKKEASLLYHKLHQRLEDIFKTPDLQLLAYSTSDIEPLDFNKMLESNLESPKTVFPNVIFTEGELRSIVRTLSQMGVLGVEMGHFELALVTQTLALRVIQVLHSEKHRDMFRVLSNISKNLFMSEKYTKAIQLQENISTQSSEIFGEADDLTITVTEQLAQQHRDLGNLDKSNDLNQQIYRLLRLQGRVKSGAYITCALELAKIALSKSNFEGAENICRELLDGALAGYPQHHTLVVRSRVLLAQAQLWRKNYVAAESMFSDIISTMLAFQHSRDDVMHIKNWLTECYTGQGKFTKSEALLREILSWWTDTLGKDDTLTLRVQQNLVIALLGQRRFEEAETLQKSAVDTLMEKHQNDKKEIALAQHTLSAVYLHEQKFAEAEELSQIAAQGLYDIFGLFNSRVVDALDTYREALDAQNQFLEVTIVLKQILAAREGIFGYTHSTTLETLDMLSDYLLRIGKGKEAEQAYSEFITRLDSSAENATEISAQLMESRLRTRANLANVKIQNGFLNDAEAMLLTDLKEAQLKFERSHEINLDLLWALQTAYIAQERWDEALPILEELHGMFRRLHGEFDGKTLCAEANILTALSHKGQYELVETKTKETLAKCSDKASLIQIIADITENLAHTFFAQGRFEEAEKTQLEALHVLKADDGPDSLNIALCEKTYSSLLFDIGKVEEAIETLLRIIPVLEEGYGKSGKSTLDARRRLALAYLKQERIPEALTILIDVIQITRETYGLGDQFIALPMRDYMDASAQAMDRPELLISEIPSEIFDYLKSSTDADDPLQIYFDVVHARSIWKSDPSRAKESVRLLLDILNRYEVPSEAQTGYIIMATNAMTELLELRDRKT